MYLRGVRAAGTWEGLLASLLGCPGRRWGAVNGPAWRGGKGVSPVKSGGCAAGRGKAAVPRVVRPGQGVGGAADPAVGAGAAGRARVRRDARPCGAAPLPG